MHLRHFDRLTQTLSTLFPQHLPTPLKIDLARRWMLMQDFGVVAREEADIDVAAILRTGRRSVVVQVDIFRGNDDELAATATVNFAAID